MPDIHQTQFLTLLFVVALFSRGEVHTLAGFTFLGGTRGSLPGATSYPASNLFPAIHWASPLC